MPKLFGLFFLFGGDGRANLHDDVMRALHYGSCSQQKTTKWRLIAVAGSLAVFQGVLATVKET